MKTIDEVIDHWREHEEPWLRSWYIGFGEPFCFACGWLAPVEDGLWGPAGEAESWYRAEGYLELVDLGSTGQIADTVALCRRCKAELEAMSKQYTFSRNQRLVWIKERENKTARFQLWTDAGLPSETYDDSMEKIPFGTYAEQLAKILPDADDSDD